MFYYVRHSPCQQETLLAEIEQAYTFQGGANNLEHGTWLSKG